MNDKRGFTLVELLAVIVVLGILSGVAIQAYSRYRQKAVNQSYDTMSQNSANAAEEYFMDHMAEDSVSIADLVDLQYLSEVVDPRDSSARCSGKVTKITSAKVEGDGKKVEYIPFKVELECIEYKSCIKKKKKKKC